MKRTKGYDTNLSNDCSIAFPIRSTSLVARLPCLSSRLNIWTQKTRKTTGFCTRSSGQPKHHAETHKIVSNVSLANAIGKYVVTNGSSTPPYVRKGVTRTSFRIRTIHHTFSDLRHPSNLGGNMRTTISKARTGTFYKHSGVPCYPFVLSRGSGLEGTYFIFC